MSARKEQVHTTATSSAANVAAFLKGVRGADNPPEVVLALLRQGPRSFPELMKDSQLDISQLDETLTLLERRALIAGEGEGEKRLYHVTEAGEGLGR